MSGNEVEPVDLEPVDLEPVEPQPGARGGPDEARRGRTPAWIWVGVVGAGLAAWGAVAVATWGDRSPHGTALPATTTAPVARIGHLFLLAPALQTAMQEMGTPRYAAVIDDRLYVGDTAHATLRLVALPEGRATIDEQSGPALHVSTFRETLVSTRPIATRVLSVHDTAFRAIVPGQWWLLRDDGTVRNSLTGETARAPDGLRASAAVPEGFVTLDVPHARWVVWSPARRGSTITPITPIAPMSYKLLGTGGHRIVFWHGLNLTANTIAIVDSSRATTITAEVPGIPQFAEFSPDGTHLAIASTLGDVVILDATTGAQLDATHSISAASPSVPFSWTPDGRGLVVVQDHRIEVRSAFTDDPTDAIDVPDGLEQLVVLP